MNKALALLTAAGVLALSSWAGGGESSANTTLTIKGMTCGGCVAAVKLQLKRTEGVTSYEVSLEKGEAQVTYDPAKTAPEKVAESVSKTGFQASVKETKAPSKSSAAEPPLAAPVQKGGLQPWEPVEAAFTGCSEGVCGMRGRHAQAVAQPGAKIGDTVYCPVSGAVFVVKESSQKAVVSGKTLYLCCAACARYFAENRSRVLALRELAL
jgi:copper chaperone CopZ/YHS domain-containing protein